MCQQILLVKKKKEYRIRTYPWLESPCSLVVEAQAMESDITDHQNKPHSAR